jgi:exopolysaccharide biosynthesis polyprenyl glycosylphosphotransferase
MLGGKPQTAAMRGVGLAVFFISSVAIAVLISLAIAARPVMGSPGGLGRNQWARLSDDAAAVRRAAGKLELSAASASAVFESAAGAADNGTAFAKRLIDIAASLCLIVGLFPLLAVVAIAVKIDSPGPVFYRQKRVGIGGRVFEVYKFRSMIADAEADGPQFARPNDDRVTRIGRFIRKTRIDEIPQTINVLRGDMSFVGPRPERPEFVAVLEREITNYHLRHIVKPGITGWAQVQYCYTASVEGAREKLRYDLYYIRHFSPLLDIWIILKTVRVTLFGVGGR